MLRSINSARGPAMSVTIHCAVIAVLFLAASHPKTRKIPETGMERVSLIEPYIAHAAPAGQGGGGGGKQSLMAASKGRAPRAAPRQFTPPAVVIENMEPKLPMEPTLVVSADIRLQQPDPRMLGDPQGKDGPPSDGRGRGVESEREMGWEWGQARVRA